MAFSQAITLTGAASAARSRRPARIDGATNFRTVGPTAHVTTSAAATAAATASGSSDGVQRVDEGSGHVRERDLVAALVEEGADEAAADVAGAEVDRLLRHARPPFSRV
jgi:hypothetical protein